MSERDASAGPEGAEEEAAAVFAGRKKKPRKPRDAPAEAAGEGGEAEQAGSAPVDAEEAEFLASITRRRRKKKRDTEPARRPETVEQIGGYSYEFLLSRLYRSLKECHPDALSHRHRIIVKPPNVVRDGTKKSAFTNFSEIAQSLHRPEDHLLAFILAELATSGSVDANLCLILKGRFQAKHIEGVLRKYIQEYVMCAMCHSLETTLEKDQHSRLYSLQCTRCGASRTVQPIQCGFSAQVSRRRSRK